jgi:hypothetical protein
MIKTARRMERKGDGGRPVQIEIVVKYTVRAYCINALAKELDVELELRMLRHACSNEYGGVGQQ